MINVDLSAEFTTNNIIEIEGAEIINNYINDSNHQEKIKQQSNKYDNLSYWNK